MAVLASLARAFGFASAPRCRVVAGSASGPLFYRRPQRRPAPPRARGRLAAAKR